MSTTTLDTLQIAKDLKAASFSDAQAEALARVLREASEVDLSHLVTKDYLDHRLRAEMADLKSDLLKWMITLLLGQAAVVAALVKLL